MAQALLLKGVGFGLIYAGYWAEDEDRSRARVCHKPKGAMKKVRSIEIKIAFALLRLTLFLEYCARPHPQCRLNHQNIKNPERNTMLILCEFHH